MPSPTPEQKEALEKFRSGRSLKIAAFAGAGKTTTLTLLARSRPGRGAYLAFNRAIADEAREKFPATVDCRTTHSMAYRPVMNSHGFSSGQMNSALTSNQLAELKNFKSKTFANKIRLDRIQQGHLILRTVGKFCQSGDEHISLRHVPNYGRLLGLDKGTLDEVRAWAVDAASGLWAEMTNSRKSDIPLGHDGYLKLWALGHPQLAFEYILLDEAQDTNPAVLAVLQEQDAQIVYVGDRHQQIYEWRGAINAMAGITDCEEAYLTQSFRFGPTIAHEASRVLQTLGERRALRGNETLASRIVSGQVGRTVLARTNATVIAEAFEAMRQSQKPHIVGGVEELKRLIGDVFNLQNGEPGASPEFFGFLNWGEVVAFAETEEGEGIRTFVQLVQQHGPKALWAAIKNAESDESLADVILSTAHKAKGREWDTVRLASDFASSRMHPDNPDVESEVRLFYVGMTRAKRTLCVDPDMLATFTTASWKLRPNVERPGSSHSDRHQAGSRASDPQRPDHGTPSSRAYPELVRRTLPPSSDAKKPASAGVVEKNPPKASSNHPASIKSQQKAATTKQGFWQRLFGRR